MSARQRRSSDFIGSADSDQRRRTRNEVMPFAKQYGHNREEKIAWRRGGADARHAFYQDRGDVL